ncbi:MULTISPECIES: LytR/AlgR family response regulator transcription factor [Dyella]|uniref:Response regulator transcription factor n=2 Tax=Dyella TaxID=231454 RepID=A0A4R0YD98_9GAMM|nr:MULTISPECIES: LytTR family DNA-binding domain-containing protein [Dyella]TBR36218.1 response regulator transcription factor [Dyella terrae]TCI05875.1 response regulator transcription factor [Dyella soli]
MRILIVDDEPLARRGVHARLAEHTDLAVVGHADNGEDAIAAIHAERPDLVFMDVQMPGLSGIDALRRVPAMERPLAILLTAYEQYAVSAFDVHALDYLLKPIDDERFAESLDRARATFRQRSAGEPAAATWPSRFSVRVGNRTAIVDSQDIDWIEACDDYAGLHVGTRTYLLREPLHQLAHKLDPARFVRIHRSTIVRVDRIAELEALPNRDCLLRLHDGTPLRASRTYVDRLHAALAAR